MRRVRTGTEPAPQTGAMAANSPVVPAVQQPAPPIDTPVAYSRAGSSASPASPSSELVSLASLSASPHPLSVCGEATTKFAAREGAARPWASSTGGQPVAPVEIRSSRSRPDSPAP